MPVTRRGLKLPAMPANVGVKAGVLSGATYPEQSYKDAETGEMVPDNRAGMPVAVIGHALHYGNGQNHPRPFIAQAAVKHKKAWANAVVTLLKNGDTIERALTTVGQVMQEDIEQEIANWPADNSEQWAAHKGFNAGLRYTRILLHSIKSQLMGGK